MRLKLSEMGEDLRRRVEAALARQGLGVAAPAAGRERAAEKAARARGPNKTEAEYNRLYLGGRGLYEAVTLKLPGGSRYTADWVTAEGGRVTLHEVKGSYRFGSQGRALTAFRECAAAFPCFDFVWACRGRSGWTVTRHAGVGKEEGS